jgi:hypothetical protein
MFTVHKSDNGFLLSESSIFVGHTFLSEMLVIYAQGMAIRNVQCFMQTSLHYKLQSLTHSYLFVHSLIYNVSLTSNLYT